MMAIDYQAVNTSHVDAALELVLAAYSEERLAVPCLPEEWDFQDKLRKPVVDLFTRGSGLAAMENGRMLGFIAGYEIGPFFGNNDGIYCPLFGHGADADKRSAIYQGLYTRAAQLWVEKGHTSHAVSLFAHDRETMDTWFWLGFGMRCVDSIRTTEPIRTQVDSAIRIRKLDQNDIPDLAELHREHNLYYSRSPIFMPREEEDPVEDLRQWQELPDHHLWAAYVHGAPQGYMRFEPEGESFISRSPKMLNNTGAYVAGDARSAGIGGALLDEALRWMRDNGYSLCGVDFEAINVSGSGFWNKHFIPYCFSVTRRIDERI